MSKFTVTITGDTLQELFASAAQIAALGGQSTAAVVPTPPINVPAPPAPAATDDDGPVDDSAPAFDKVGTPWDARIHASSKAINEDGTWRKRRNLADITYTTVMAELAQRTAGQAPAAPPTLPVPQVPASLAANVDASPIPVPQAPAIPSPPMAAPVAAIPAIPPAPAVAPEQPTPPAPVASAPVNVEPPPVNGMPFHVFMPKISEAIKAGKFSTADLDGYLATWQLTNIGQLQIDPVKAEQFYHWLKGSNLVD